MDAADQYHPLSVPLDDRLAKLSGYAFLVGTDSGFDRDHEKSSCNYVYLPQTPSNLFITPGFHLSRSVPSSTPLLSG